MEVIKNDVVHKLSGTSYIPHTHALMLYYTNKQANMYIHILICHSHIQQISLKHLHIHVIVYVKKKNTILSFSFFFAPAVFRFSNELARALEDEISFLHIKPAIQPAFSCISLRFVMKPLTKKLDCIKGGNQGFR